jgi:predicted KAP-like P-loop ATPase
MNLIQCFSSVVGHKEAQELITDLNQMKSSKSEDFYIKYDEYQDYSTDDNYLVIGNVTKEDWDELDLESDFIEGFV